MPKFKLNSIAFGIIHVSWDGILNVLTFCFTDIDTYRFEYLHSTLYFGRDIFMTNNKLWMEKNDIFIMPQTNLLKYRHTHTLKTTTAVKKSVQTK